MFVTLQKPSILYSFVSDGHNLHFFTGMQVDLCFLVDCTSSMSRSIEAVKNNVKQLRDGLDAQYKGCDLRFAFVRYTDYDQPASTRTTWIDFTKLVEHTQNSHVVPLRILCIDSFACLCSQVSASIPRICECTKSCWGRRHS